MKIKRWIKKEKCCLNKATAGNVFDSKSYLQKRLLEVFCFKSIVYLLITETTRECA